MNAAILEDYKALEENREEARLLGPSQGLKAESTRKH